MELLACLKTAGWFSLSLVAGIIGVNSKQTYRPYLLVCLIFFALHAFWNITDHNLGIEGTESASMLVIIYLSHMTTVLCIEKHVLPKKSSPYIDWRGGYFMLFNARWLGTTRQAPDIKMRCKKPSEDDEISSPGEQKEQSTSFLRNFRKSLQSPKGKFLRNRVISLAIIYTIIQIHNYFVFGSKYNLELELIDFLPSKESYFRRLNTVSVRETIVRTWLVSYWVFYSVGMYTGFHDVFALFFVGIGLDKPEDWPPLFGNPSEATSVRNFWGKFWHRLVYRSYTSYGVWITKNVLRLPRNSIIGKYFINFLVFLISGFAHAFSVRQLGFSCGFWQEVGFYCTSFLAILLESLVIAIFTKLTRRYKINSTISNTFGYVWVFTYLFITLPKSQYPKLWCAPQY